MAALSAVNLVRPWWTLGRAVVRLANQVATTGIAIWLLHAGAWFSVEAPALSPGRTADLDRLLNLSLLIAFLWIVALTAIAIVRRDLPRVRRLGRAHSAAKAPATP